jgi:cation transport regulator ChaC
MIFLLSLVGCSNLYYGHTKEQWVSMTDLEQQKAKASYEEIIRAKQEHVNGNPRDDATNAFIGRAVGKTGN